jgi:Holliday junction resolvasome RuvABC endonuclease subunit
MHNVLAIDPATLSGWALTCPSGPVYFGKRLVESGYVVMQGREVYFGTFNAKPQPKTKKRVAQPAYYRPHYLYDFVRNVIEEHGVDRVVVESAAAFIKGKAAVEVSHKLRAAIEIAIVECNEDLNYTISLEYLDPPDLKFAALGKRTGSKEEMIARAERFYGYRGHEDNEADAIHLMGWALG